MLRKARNTNPAVLSRTDKQQIDSFVMKPHNIGRECYVLGHDRQGPKVERVFIIIKLTGTLSTFTN